MADGQKEMPPATAGELAYVLGISARSITTLKKQGVLKPTAADKRKYDLQENVHYFMQYRSGGNEAEQGRRANLVAQQTRKLKLQNDELAGVLLHTDKAKEIFMEYAQAIRGGVSALPGRLATVLAGENSPTKIKGIINDEVRSLLDHAEKAFDALPQPRRQKRGGDTAGHDDTKAPAETKPRRVGRPRKGATARKR